MNICILQEILILKTTKYELHLKKYLLLFKYSFSYFSDIQRIHCGAYFFCKWSCIIIIFCKNKTSKNYKKTKNQPFPENESLKYSQKIILNNKCKLSHQSICHPNEGLRTIVDKRNVLPIGNVHLSFQKEAQNNYSMGEKFPEVQIRHQ